MDKQTKLSGKICQIGVVHFVPLLIIAVFIALVIYVSKDPYPSKIPTKEASLPAQVKATATPIPTSSPSITPTPIPTKEPVSTAAVSGPPGAGLSNITVATEKGNFKAMVFAVDLTNAKIVTDTADDSDCANDCKTLTLKEFVEKNNGFAGVNGSYFCPDTYPECASKKNSFDFPVYNSRLNKWINQRNLFWDSRAIVYTDGTGIHYLQNAKEFTGGLSAGMVNYPGILDSGSIQLSEDQAGLSDKQKAKGQKVGIGIRDNYNVMIVIAQDVTMLEFAHIFKSLGAVKALNLDTGGSTALYYNGNYVAGPGRNIPNAIIFTR